MKHAMVIYNTPNGTMYQLDSGYPMFVRTLSQMEYEISPLLYEQRLKKYGPIANSILDAGGLLVDIGSANAKDTRDFFGDPR